MFECEFSKPDLKVEWYQGEKMIPRSYKFTPRNDGRTYRLMIKDAATDDAGPISCAVDATKTTANLIVKGDDGLIHDQKFLEQILSSCNGML